MVAGVEGSCDFDGDEYCAVGISGEPNLELCSGGGGGGGGGGFNDCNDDDEAINPGAEERCDEIDWDCDGDSHNGYADFGESCADGEGQCAADGEYICSEDGFSTECTAEAGEPAEEERCDDLDWTCDGDPLTGYPVGDVCEVEFEDCTLAGAYICAEDGTMVCEPSLDECPADEVPDNPELEYEARGSGLGCSSSNGEAPAGEFVFLLMGLFALGAGRRRSSKKMIR
jgi:MYXO-CTERM domain-containing protein